jgi:uncharacterized protein (TIGR02594 family)
VAHKNIHAPNALTVEELLFAPWMKVALAEYGKGVKENPADKDFERQFYLSLAQHNSRFSLLDWNKLDHEIAKKVADQSGPLLMEGGNADVSKYLRSTHLDHLTRRDTVAVNGSHKTIDHEWRMQAWCAAFVNWCLLQVSVKPLGSARAADWLRFGTPIHHPSRGAIVVVAPSSATNAKGGSGHVAFFGGFEGSQIWMLGGNQHREVCWMQQSVKSVRGYRWPVSLGDYPRTNSDSLA